MELQGFPHIAGTHCSSSSIADVLRYDGIDVSEAMVFGLGSGVGFIYSGDPRYSPVHRFNGRASDLEGKFYELLGQPLRWAGAWKPEAIEQALAAGRPLLAQTDIAYLPYYEPAHFPFHGIVITGWDGRAAIVADTFSDELQSVPSDRLRVALVGEGSPFMTPYNFAAAPRVALALDAELLSRAIARAAAEMLEPTVAGTGLPAMRRLAADREAWRKSADWAWSARFAYQSIEKRGTGGGGFRGMYARFLEESRPFLPWLDRIDAVAQMRESAREWSAMAGELKAAFVDDDPSRIEAAGERLDRIAAFEARLMERLRLESARDARFER
jgi:hypothetical protein